MIANAQNLVNNLIFRKEVCQYKVWYVHRSALKNKGEEMKGKLVDYITNPSGSESGIVRHVSSKDRAKKTYRNRPSVFAIDDTDEICEWIL